MSKHLIKAFVSKDVATSCALAMLSTVGRTDLAVAADSAAGTRQPRALPEGDHGVITCTLVGTANG